MTLTLPEWTTDNVINGCNLYRNRRWFNRRNLYPIQGTDGTGAVTTQVTTFNSIQSITCTGTGFNLLARSLTVSVDSGAGTSEVGLVIVITDATDYAIGSTAVALDSDLGLALTGGVAPAASFVWSDQSAQGHALTTTDWTNGYLVKEPAN